jgi:hypothetical protein
MDFIEITCEEQSWMDLIQCYVQWRDQILVVISLRVILAQVDRTENEPHVLKLRGPSLILLPVPTDVISWNFC